MSSTVNTHMERFINSLKLGLEMFHTDVSLIHYYSINYFQPDLCNTDDMNENN